MKKSFLIFFSFFSLYSTFNVSAGNEKAKQKKKMSDTLEKANFLFDEKVFLSALPIYQYLIDSSPDKKQEMFYKYRLGICCLFKTDRHDKSLALLTEVEEKNNKAADIQFYLGRAYMLNYKFDEAILRFTEYNSNKKFISELKAEALRYIENCTNGKALMANPVDVVIENIGAPINTSESEYVPVISSDESVLIYTYRGEKSKGGLQVLDKNNPVGAYFEDVYISEKTNGKWNEPYNAGDSINSNEHDACIALSGDGQKLFVFKNDGVNLGDIYISALDGKNWSAPVPLKGSVNTPFWEGSCSISADERTLYFSSEREGGFGGRDLYKAILQSDGSWGNIKNLGSEINTPLDDDAPFIHPDGTTLIFSSKGHNSMGGYDIFKTFRNDTAWTKPENMGYPINTPDDDVYYVLSADGKRGYYSSAKSGGMGQQDIYVVTPGLPGWKPTLVQLRGTVTFNDKPTDAEMAVVLVNNNDTVARYKSNSATGKYLINLPAGGNYKLVYKREGDLPQEKSINNTSVDSFTVLNLDVPFFDKLNLNLVDSSGKVIATGEQKKYNVFHFEHLNTDSVMTFAFDGKDIDSLKEIIVQVNDSNYKLVRCGNRLFCYRPIKSDVVDLKNISEKDVPFGKAANYSEIVSSYGSIQTEGLVFNVQIGAYRNPDKFNYKKLSQLGEVSKKKYDDALTRFTIGNFSTLENANELLKNVKTEGFNDAFVTAFYNGKRFLLQDLGTLKK